MRHFQKFDTGFSEICNSLVFESKLLSFNRIFR